MSTSPHNWLAIDVGGANLKLADGLGFTLSIPFALWREPEELAAKLREGIAQAPPSDHLAITMTGELADCYPSKCAGVSAILGAVESAANGRHTRIYMIDGRLVALPAARRDLVSCAATNWHALARFSARFVPANQCGLLVDTGSTTTDVIPLNEHGATTSARTDLQRLGNRELLYTGVTRSPVCAVTNCVTYRGASYQVAQEFFASMQDVYTMLDELAEDTCDTATADGRPATRTFARRRLARVLCADETEFHHRDAVVLAESVRDSHVRSICDCLRHVSARFAGDLAVIVTCGAGEFLIARCLAHLAWNTPTVSVRRRFNPRVSACATAHALAVLARAHQSETTWS